LINGFITAQTAFCHCTFSIYHCTFCASLRIKNDTGNLRVSVGVECLGILIDCSRIELLDMDLPGKETFPAIIRPGW